MQLSRAQILHWFQNEAEYCSIEELNQYEYLLIEAQDKVRARDANARHALEAAEAAAKTAGFESLEALLRATKPSALTVTAPMAHLPSTVPQRKPYLDPLNPQTEAHALYKNRNMPDWVQQRLKDGWSLEELHYKRHAAALKARGIEPLYNAIEKHSQLMAAEPPRYRRNQIR